MIVLLKRPVAMLAIALLAFQAPRLHAQSTNSIGDQVKALVDKIQLKVAAGKTEADAADELKQFDALLAQQNGAKTEAAAELIHDEAVIYAALFGDFDKATSLVEKIKSEYPNTHPAEEADAMLANFAQQARARKIQAALIAGTALPDFSETDIEGKPLAPAGFKGKVVLIDFWATWCPPCRAELPNVIAIYKKYHALGFEIIGVSLDSEKAKLASFIKDQDMPWQQYCDGQEWSNKLVEKFGVDAIPFTILVDGDGKIIGTRLMGSTLEAAVSKALKQ